MKHLSYETLYNVKDMLTKQINRENKATDLFQMDTVRLNKLQDDLKIINQALANKTKLNQRIAKESVTI